jgi:Lactonase, 7-bladed beta-propeller
MFLYGSYGPSVLGGKIDSTTGEVVSVPMPTNPSTGVIGFESGGRGSVAAFAIDRHGRFVYTAEVQTFFANRPLGNNAIGAFTIDRNSGVLNRVAGSPYVLSERLQDIAIDGSGRFVYVSFLQTGIIEIWSVNDSSGTLTHVGSSTGGGGNLATTWDGRFLLSNANEAVTSYSIDQVSGELTPVSIVPVGRTRGLSLSIGNKQAYSWTGNIATVLSLDSDGELAVQKAGVVLQGGDEVLYISVGADNRKAYVTIGGHLVHYDGIGGDQLGIFGTTVEHAEVDFNSKFVYAANSSGDPLQTYTINSNGAVVAGPIATGPVAIVAFFRLSP